MKDIKFKEGIRHGTTFFPFRCYEMYGEKQQMMVSIHWHEEVEWLYVKTGCLEVIVDDTCSILKSNELFIIPSQCIHQIIAKEKCSYFAIVFNFSFLNFQLYDSVESKFLSPIAKGKQQVEKISNVHKIKAIFNPLEYIIKASGTQNIAWELEVKASLLLLIAQFHKQQKIQTNCQDEENKVMKDVYTYLHEHYQEKIYVNEIAKSVHLNEQYLCRYFKTNSGKSIMEYLNQYRVEQACALLKECEDSVMDIAFRCGYENISYFIARFKKLKQMTPLAYRKMVIHKVL